MNAQVDMDPLVVLDREMKVGVYSLPGYRRSHALLVGAGAVCGLVGMGLVRKAIGLLTICDGDTVAPTNLNRQFFHQDDIGKPKAMALAENLADWCVSDTCITGIDSFVEEIEQGGAGLGLTLVVSCPDNNEAREYTAAMGVRLRIPCVIIGLSEDSDYGYVFVQTSKDSDACWGCMQRGRSGRRQCGVAANINLAMLFSGVVLSACDALVSGHALKWNYRRLSLSGNISDIMRSAPVWTDCPICGNGKTATGSAKQET